MSELPLERTAEEALLLPPLMVLLNATGRIRPDTYVLYEFPWHGRRIDVVTLTRSGVLSSYELKLGGFGRVTEQAVYNGMSFDRSWVVVDRFPTTANLEMARSQQLGVVVVRGSARVALHAAKTRNDLVLRQRLRRKIVERVRSGV